MRRVGLAILLATLVLSGCATGAMISREVHYYAVTNGEDTNYYRLKVCAYTKLGVAEYRSGYFPADAVDALYGDVSPDGGLDALATRRRIEAAVNDAIERTTKEYLRRAALTGTSEAYLAAAMEARRRVRRYPLPGAAPQTGSSDLGQNSGMPATFELEYNPEAGIFVRHADEKLLFVLSSDPDQVLKKITDFTEDQKTALAIRDLGKIVRANFVRDLAVAEGRDSVERGLDQIVHTRLASAAQELGDSAVTGDTKRLYDSMRAEIEALRTLLKASR